MPRSTGKKEQLQKYRAEIDQKYFDFFQEWSPYSAWAYGLILGDGHVNDVLDPSTGKGSGRITLACQQEIVEKFANLFPWRERDAHPVPNKNIWEFYFRSPSLVEWFRKRKVERIKSRTLPWPTDIPDHLMKYFVIGLIDTDGSWHIEKRDHLSGRPKIGISFGSANHSFTSSFKEWIGAKYVTKSFKHYNGKLLDFYSCSLRGIPAIEIGKKIYSSDIALKLAYSKKLEIFREGVNMEEHYALPCEVIGCGRRKRTIRFCARHELINKAPDTGCSVDGCGGSLFSKGFCQKHYHSNRMDLLNPERKKVGRSGWYVDIRNKVYSGELDIPEKGKSIATGINFKKSQQRWLASFTYKTKCIPIGYFETRELAEQAKIDFFSYRSSQLHRYSTILKGSEINDGFRIIYRTRPVFIDWEIKGKERQIFNLLQSKNEKIDRIFARKTELKEINKTIASKFLVDFHIQKSPKNIISAYGLYHKNELMMVATVSRHHRNINKIVLSRFCTRSGFVVVGGLSKLSKYAFLRHGQLISWVDLRWGSTESYEKSGWVKDARIASDYFYLDPKKECVISKQSRKKSNVNTPDGLTEAEHARKDGLIRVYDSGKVRLIYNASILPPRSHVWPVRKS